MATHKNEEAQRERVTRAETRPSTPEPLAPTPPETTSEAPEAREAAPASPTEETEARHGGVPASPSARGKGSEKRLRNNVRKIRLERMMSKAELARRAAVSTLTIDRIERGMPCRMDTKRKILEALGLKPSDRETVFGPDDRED